MIEGKCALITGSVGGLGFAAAQQFADAGCNIVLSGFAEPSRIAEARREIEAAHHVRTIHSNADLRHPSEIERMFREAEAAFGGVDILVNNAVVRHAAPVESFSVEAWNDGIAVNLSAAFHTIRLAVPGMKARGWGRIINVSSIYGLIGAANRANYVTCKTALIGLTRAVALELMDHNITCNTICPGSVLTPVHEATLQTAMARESISREEAERRFHAGKQPSGRFIAAEDVARFMVFLCGPGSRDIHGAALPIEGAWSIS
ncbi:MAG TPA: SDR family NAD(P)-dependent oxidoreductase [Bryobacteraceae bacterium]|jgi:3-hydroxybutyrate dehydrogenase|nr:SDR family NAD(P)-dependent oxidoreductase [Bryobacteraceae bacterium]